MCSRELEHVHAQIFCISGSDCPSVSIKKVNGSLSIHPHILCCLRRLVTGGFAGAQTSADDARRLFDGMPPGGKDERAPPVRGADHIGALPDPMLQHILSFLPAQAAVRTCVLARRWRHLWRSTRGLCIVGLEGSGPVQELRKFVDHLLVLRERTDLDTVEIRFNRFSVDNDEAYVNLWTRFAVMGKVRALTLHIDASSYLDLDNLPLVSQHLRVLNLDGVSLQQKFLDFASCPALEVLNMTHCDISVAKISSRSLKHLSIRSCRSNSNCWVHVSTPGLVSLVLVRFGGTTPFLENMALLESARVDLSDDFDEVYLDYDSDENCVPFNKDDNGDRVLLGGLSGVKHLELISAFQNFTFRRDLRQCPTFSKLKTLLLNESWCEAPDLDPLACILKNSPVLEKLTLQLFTKGPKKKVKMKGSYSSVERSSAISERLNIVEVQCNVVNEGVLNVLKFLCSFNIR